MGDEAKRRRAWTPMVQWKFLANNPQINTVVGVKSEGYIELQSKAGCGLFGPYLDLPASICTARILLDGPRVGNVLMDIAAEAGRRVVASRVFDLDEVNGNALQLSTKFDTPLSAVEIRLHCYSGACAKISAVEIDLIPSTVQILDLDRPVGYESKKTYSAKIASGFFAKYLAGDAILEIGYRGYTDGTVPIVPQAIGIDLDYPGYDGLRLPFSDESQDAIYSSHCLEHIQDSREALREWYRVLKIGGYLAIVVPHHHLFERRRGMPSAWNRDHKRFYTPAGLLREVEEAFPPNSYRIRHLVDNDLGFDYSVTPLEAGVGCYEIELVLEKLRKPGWDLEDGTSRSYSANEFTTSLVRSNPWWLETDFSTTDTCVAWGPYVPLAAGEFEAKFFFEANDDCDAPLASEIVLDVGQNTTGIAAITMSGEEGRRILHRGSATIRFTNSIHEAYFEFRVFTRGRPFHGKFRFYGVSLNRLWPSGEQIAQDGMASTIEFASPEPLANVEVRLSSAGGFVGEIAELEISGELQPAFSSVELGDLPAVPIADTLSRGRSLYDGYQRGVGLQFTGLAQRILRDPDYNDARQLAGSRTILGDLNLCNIFLICKFYLPRLAEGHLVEFGSYTGGGAIFMAALARKFLPARRVLAFDTFAGMPPTDSRVDHHQAGAFAGVDLAELRRYTAAIGLDNLEFVQGNFADTAAPALHRIGTVSFAHLDCDIRSAIQCAYDTTKPHMVSGGYWILDDPMVSDCLAAAEAMEDLLIRRDGLNSEQVYPHYVFRQP